MFKTNISCIGRALILLLRLPHNSLINSASQRIISLSINVFADFVMMQTESLHKFSVSA